MFGPLPTEEEGAAAVAAVHSSTNGHAVPVEEIDETHAEPAHDSASSNGSAIHHEADVVEDEQLDARAEEDVVEEAPAAPTLFDEPQTDDDGGDECPRCGHEVTGGVTRCLYCGMVLA